MEFCNNCGKPLKIKRGVFACICGFTKEAGQIIAKEIIEKPSPVSKEILEEIKPDVETGFPFECGNCSHKFAEVVDLGVSYSDESNVTLFKCKKCNKVKRDAFGSSIS